MIRAAIACMLVLVSGAGCANHDKGEIPRGKGSVRWVLDDEAAKLTPEAHGYYWERWGWRLSPQPPSRCPVIDQSRDSINAWERGLSK